MKSPLRLSLSRAVRFRSTHRYEIAGASELENRSRFGRYAITHPHDYVVEVTVVGPAEPPDYFVVDLDTLDALLEREIVTRFDGRDLNEEIEEVREGRMLPSTEALAGWLFDRLSPAIPGEARLVRVRVAESDDLAATYEAERVVDPPETTHGPGGEDG